MPSGTRPGPRRATSRDDRRSATSVIPSRLALPEMVLRADQLEHVGRRTRHHRNPRLVKVSVLTMIAVTGHFVSYTYIVVIIRDVVGVRGPNLAWLLAAYGVAGLVSVPLVARPLDRWPKGAVIVGMTGLTAAFTLLTALAFGERHTAATALLGTGAIVLWGALATAVSPMLQSAAMRSGGDDPDGASGLYVTAFQIGIMAGALLGGLLYERSLAMMLTASAGLMGVALFGMTVSQHLFENPTLSPGDG